MKPVTGRPGLPPPPAARTSAERAAPRARGGAEGAEGAEGAATRRVPKNAPALGFEPRQVAQWRESLIEAAERSASVARPPRPRTTQPMTVATLALAGQGGSGKVGRVCADAAAHAGHRSILLTGADGFWERETQHDYVVRPVDAPQTPTRPEPGWVDKLAGQIAQSVREEGIEVLAVHYVAGLLDAALLAREQLRAEGRTLAVTATLHGTDISTWGKDAEYGPKLGALLKQCDDVTAVSEWLADTSLKLLDLEQRPRVISNAIETETFNASGWATPAAQGAGSDIRRALAPHDEVVLISVTNLRAVKRPQDAVETLAKVRARGVNAKLVLAGDGPMLPSLYELAKQLGVAESIVPVGALGPAELARWLCASDFALVNSESESFCLAALEAMACGVPVLGTRCGGLEEVVSTVSPDLLSDVGDTDSMADQCVRLISDPDRYHALQERCMAVPHTIYLQDRQENAYVSMFEDLRPAGAAAQLPR